jgi:hypothetical protein
MLHAETCFAGVKLFRTRLHLLDFSVDGCGGSICSHHGANATRAVSRELL